MPRTTRSTNLDLIRWMNLGHKNTAKRLSPVISSATDLSKMATGEKEITDQKARAIENKLGLPAGWLDRDNVAFLKTATEDYSLLQAMAQLPSEAKIHLGKFAASVR